jgi:hypothetical protein
MEDDATVKDFITTLFSRFKGLQGDHLNNNEIGYDNMCRYYYM